MEKYKVTKLPLNLQFFSEEDGDKSTEDKNENVEQVTLTPEELNKKIESESDKKLAKVLERKNAERQAEIDAAVQKALQEDKRLSKLSEADRKAEELSQKEKDLADREAAIARTQVKSEVIAELSTRKLPVELAEYVTLDDNEKALEQIKSLNDIIDGIKRDAVKEATRQSIPGAGSTVFAAKGSTGETTAEKFRAKRII